LPEGARTSPRSVPSAPAGSCAGGGCRGGTGERAGFALSGAGLDIIRADFVELAAGFASFGAGPAAFACGVRFADFGDGFARGADFDDLGFGFGFGFDFDFDFDFDFNFDFDFDFDLGAAPLLSMLTISPSRPSWP
jgi:hypothetical protein